MANNWPLAIVSAKPSAWIRNIIVLEWRISIRSLIKPQIKVEPSCVEAMIVNVVAATIALKPISVT